MNFLLSPSHLFLSLLWLGGVSLGCHSQGDPLQHWIDCLKNKGTKVERWHTLTNELPGSTLQEWTDPLSLTPERLPKERRFTACSEDVLHAYEGFTSCLLCVKRNMRSSFMSHSEINTVMEDLNRPNANLRSHCKANIMSISLIIFIALHVPFVDLMSIVMLLRAAQKVVRSQLTRKI